MHQRGAPDGVVVLLRELPERRVDQQVDLARHDQVDRVRATLVHLQHPLRRHAPSAEIPLRPFGRQDPKTHLVKAPHDRHDRRLVGVVHRDENAARQRQAAVGRDLRLGERHPEALGDPHDLAGRAHLRAQNGIYAGQFGEGEDRLLAGDPRHGELVRNPQFVEGFPHHYGRGQPGERGARGLADEGNGAGRPGVHFQHVDHPPLDGVLHVEEPHDAQGLGKGGGRPPHLLDLAVTDEIRGQHAGGIAGMDAGVLDVLHDPAHHATPAVGDGVDVGFEGVLEKVINEHRMFGRDARGLLEELLERRLVVHDLHRAPAEHVGRSHQHRIADALRHHGGLGDGAGRAVGRLGDAEAVGELLEALSVFGGVDGVG